jgi:hypothetical protein
MEESTDDEFTDEFITFDYRSGRFDYWGDADSEDDETDAEDSSDEDYDGKESDDEVSDKKESDDGRR